MDLCDLTVLWKLHFINPRSGTTPPVKPEQGAKEIF